MNNNDIGKIFTKDEIDEIEVFSEGTKAMLVNGEEIICFSLLSDLIQGHLQIAELSRDVLIKTYTQLKESNQICSELAWLDSSTLEKITQNAKKLIMYELERRKIL